MEIIIAIDFENEEGQIVDQVELEEPIKLNPNKLVIPNFCICNSYSQNTGNVLRLQFEFQNKEYDQFDVDETLQEFIENIMLEADDEDLFSDLIIEQIRSALSSTMLIN